MNSRSKKPQLPAGAISETLVRQTQVSYQHSNRKASGRSTAIYVGRKVVGHVNGSRFMKRVEGSKHFLLKPRAIAFDVSTLHDAEAAGAIRVEVIDTETGRGYTSSVVEIWANGFRVNRGFGEQWAMLIGKWRLSGEKAVQQLSLFGGGT